MEQYNPEKIEKKWQKFWLKEKIFEANDSSKKPKFYVLDMFPYPSSYGLHVGHLRGYTFSDLIAKKKIMEGYNVLHPMGWDAFGLPAENFAIKTGIHPAITTSRAIENIKKQLIAAGFGYDWSREICSCQPDYYKWTQWMFLQLYKAGLVYRKKALVNFCPSCQTVLANEQVIDGKCERCGTEVEMRYLDQWFFKITKYADRLIAGLEKIDWPRKIKTMQRNWIGKSEGTEVIFSIANSSFKINVFTTRVDTLFGCSYIVIAPEHPIIEKLKPLISNFKEVQKYIKKASQESIINRLAETKEKEGIELKGLKAINPVNNQKVPVFIADYVLMDYGTGAIMAVPAHDKRDFDFAKNYNLPIIKVIKPEKGQDVPGEVFEEDGILVNSQSFSHLKSSLARKKITEFLSKKNLGKKAVYYKLKDWLISRQRYWGAPIPMIFCPNCGWLTVPEKDLPVLLPKIKDFKPHEQGQSPLAKSKKFVEVKCPKCGATARRETDTMDTFVCSSWYFLRYLDPKNKKLFASEEKIKKWFPVDLYIGGAEHAVLHLLYARFFTKFLFDKKLVPSQEPFSKLFNQGTVYYKGAKMSKSRGNVVNPDYIIKKFGADTMRLYELFMGPADQAVQWSDKGVVGCYRFLNKVWNLYFKIGEKVENKDLEKLVHKTIKKVSYDIEKFRFNTAVAALMVLVNKMTEEEKIPKEYYELLLKLLAPMTPHISQELWQKLGHKKSIFFENWPSYNSNLAKEKNIILIVQINGKIRDKIEAEIDISQEQAKELAISSRKIQKWIRDKEIKNIIFVPNKLINIVIKD